MTQLVENLYPGLQQETLTYPGHPSQPVQATHVSRSVRPRLTAYPEHHSQLVQLPYQFQQQQPGQITNQAQQPQLTHQQVNPVYPVQPTWPWQTSYQGQSQQQMQLTYPAQPSADPHSHQFLQPERHIPQSGHQLNQHEF